MTSPYKITNHVLDEIDLMSSNLEKEQHQRNYIPMIVKIYRKRGKKNKKVGGGDD
jgi:hypothetical protein